MSDTDPYDSHLINLVESGRKQRNAEELKELDRRKLSGMKDKDLALWQGNFTPDEPSWRLAEYEWQRRLAAKQIRASHITAWVGVIGTLVGVLLGWWLSMQNQRTNPPIQSKSKSYGQPQQQETVTTPKPQQPVISGQPPLNPHP